MTEQDYNSVTDKFLKVRKHCRITFKEKNPNLKPSDMDKLEKKVDNYLHVFKEHVEAMGGTFELKIEFPPEEPISFSSVPFFAEEKATNGS
nr:hypothetical protein [Candidatus Parabeggiatoa sp.]